MGIMKTLLCRNKKIFLALNNLQFKFVMRAVTVCQCNGWSIIFFGMKKDL